jgi:serine/threonine-protein phosphatase 2A activator
MQHFLFGSLIAFNGTDFQDDVGIDGHAHVYAFGQQFPDCCGMRIPSAVAAAAATGAGDRPMAFD